MFLGTIYVSTKFQRQRNCRQQKVAISELNRSKGNSVPGKMCPEQKILLSIYIYM
jgi:hypothetical protein